MRRMIIAAALFVQAPISAVSQGHAHSQAAAQFGTVHFPTSCGAAVSRSFDLGVAQLHSFEFGAAIRTFNEVLAADSNCAMAHWGIALSRWGNPMAAGNRAIPLLRQGREAADAAARLESGASARERGYIRAVAQLYDDYEKRDQRTRMLAYESAMNELAIAHADDMEAKIFHALALSAAALPTDKTYANQLKAGGILESLWAKHPEHPGLAHYIIHSYDYPPLAGKARAAARLYSGIAPSAAHALHMPSHTFTRVGMWRESVSSNDRSMKTALGNGSIAEALHAADYSVYAHLQMGHEAKAKALADQLPALAARFDPNAITGAAPASAAYFALAAIPARWALERGAWAEAAALVPKPTAFPHTDAMTYFARSLGASRTGDLAKARTSIDSLASMHAQLLAKNEAYWAEQVAIQHLAAQAWLDLAEGRKNDALTKMREAAVREDATEKSAVTPGPLAPARELLGDMLMQLNRPAEARAEYRATLKNEPNRRRSMRALAVGQRRVSKSRSTS